MAFLFKRLAIWSCTRAQADWDSTEWGGQPSLSGTPCSLYSVTLQCLEHTGPMLRVSSCGENTLASPPSERGMFAKLMSAKTRGR